jgi:hypothetical protein
MVIRVVLLLICLCAGAIATPVFNTDGAPTVLRDEKRFAHIVADTITFGVDSTTVTLRSSSTDNRVNVAFTSSTSYIVVATGADSIVNQTGSSFKIFHPAGLNTKIHSYIAVGN